MKQFFEPQLNVLPDVFERPVPASDGSAGQQDTLSDILRDVFDDPALAHAGPRALGPGDGADGGGAAPAAFDPLVSHPTVGNMAPLPLGDGDNASSFDTYVSSVGGAADWVNTTINGQQNRSQIAALGNGGYVVVFSDTSQALGAGTQGEIRAQRFDANGVKVGGEFVIDQVTSTNARYPAVASTANGGFVATWADTTYGVRARAFDQNGTALTGDFSVQDNLNVTVVSTAMASLADGHYMITWVERIAASGSVPAHYETFAKVYDANNAAVGSEFGIAPPGSSDQYYATIAAVGDQFVLTWTNIQTGAGNDHSEVLGQRFGATGQSIGGTFQVNTATDNYQYDSTVGALTDGSFVIAYSSVTSATDSSIYFQRFDHNGSKVGGETLVSNGLVGEEVAARVGSLQDGNFVVGWSHIATHTAGSLDATPDIYVQEYLADGTPLGGTFGVGTPPPLYGNEYYVNADYVAFGTLASGRLVTTWTDYNSYEPGANQSNGVGIRQHLVDPMKLLFGDDQANTLTATNAPTAIEGNGGDDTLTGGSADDQIDGGTGNDVIHGGVGNDTIYGGEGNDQIFGDAGNDTIDGGDGDDVINGGAGSDILHGGAGNDTLFDSSSGTMFGEDGNDVVTAYNGGYLDGGAGNDQLTLLNLVNNSQLSGGDGSDTLTVDGNMQLGMVFINGDAGDDFITVTNVRNTAYVYGGDGNDTVRVDNSSANITLGNGQDLLIVGSTTSNLSIYQFVAGEAGDRVDLSIFGPDPFGPGGRLSFSSGTIIDSQSSFRLGIGNPNNLSSFNLGVNNPLYNPQGMTLDGVFASDPTIEWYDYLVGADGNDLIRAYGGNDTLFGAGGNDRLDGGFGADTMDGGTGNDTFVVDNLGDVVIERAGGGTDMIETSLNNYVLSATGNVENLTLTGGSATGSGNDLDNVLTGNALANTLYGYGGNDTLNGGGGVDTLLGGAGNDRLIVGAGGNGTIVDGGADGDTLVVTGAATLGGLAGIEAIEFQSGGALTLIASQFTAGLAPNATLSGTGALTINMGAGDFDLYLQQLAGGSEATITVNGPATGMVVKGAINAVNIINGGDGADSIRGGTRADTLSGGIGNDKIEGGQGADILTGGAGADTFRYQSANASGLGINADHITDFVSGTDKLGFQLLDANPGTPAIDPFGYIGTQAFHATGAAEIRYETTGADLTVQVDVNGDGFADMAIILQGLGGGSLTSGDFLI